MRNTTVSILIILGSMFFFSCTNLPSKGNRDGKRPPFKPISGIDFYEVRRAFDNGLAFDTLGFQQEPLWHINFTHDDSVKILNNERDSMLHFAIYYDQDSIFHFGREWFRVKSLAKDSLLLQRLTVQNLRVKEARSNVYMKFYSGDFIQNYLKKSVDELRRPTAQDTAFVQQMIDKTNRNPSNLDSLFAARMPVSFLSIHPNAKVEKRIPKEEENLSRTAAYSYLYPEYEIKIVNTYKDFYYPFSVFVDTAGKMTVANFVTSPEFEESRRKVLQGIVDVYLENYLQITPGSTLGIPHNTLVMLYVRGIENE